MSSLATLLTLELQQRGWSITTLARKAGYDRTLVGRWLAGTREPNPAQLTRLAEVLGSRVLRLVALGMTMEPVVREQGEMEQRLAAAGVKLRENDGIRTCEREAA